MDVNQIHTRRCLIQSKALDRSISSAPPNPFLNHHQLTMLSIITLAKIPHQKRIENLVKHIRQGSLREQFFAELFLQKAPFQLFVWVLNTSPLPKSEKRLDPIFFSFKMLSMITKVFLQLEVLYEALSRAGLYQRDLLWRNNTEHYVQFLLSLLLIIKAV